MRSALLQYFPAAVEAFEDLAAPDALSVLRRAPNPDLAAKLTRVQLVAAPRSARRHHVEAKAGVLLKVLRGSGVAPTGDPAGCLPERGPRTGHHHCCASTTRSLDFTRSRKNYSGQSPITRASGKKSVVLARYATNRRLGAALHLQAFAALGASPEARAYYDALRRRNIGHHAALRQLANRLVGILHGCLKSVTVYDENATWQQHEIPTEAAAA